MRFSKFLWVSWTICVQTELLGWQWTYNKLKAQEHSTYTTKSILSYLSKTKSASKGPCTRISNIYWARLKYFGFCSCTTIFKEIDWTPSVEQVAATWPCAFQEKILHHWWQWNFCWNQICSCSQAHGVTTSTIRMVIARTLCSIIPIIAMDRLPVFKDLLATLGTTALCSESMTEQSLQVRR